MAQAEGEMLAACGLDCGPCPIRRIPFDAEAAEGMIAWFKQMGWLKEWRCRRDRARDVLQGLPGRSVGALVGQLRDYAVLCG